MWLVVGIVDYSIYMAINRLQDLLLRASFVLRTTTGGDGWAWWADQPSDSFLYQYVRR
jgi:hypothetical protein